MSAFRRAVAYGKTNIDFSISHVNRKTLEIAVHPDQTVVIKAPLGTDEEVIRTKVVKRAGWIIKQQDFFRQFQPRTPARQYLGGETHLYLGRRYRLKIRNGGRDTIKLARGYFEVEIRGVTSPERVRVLLEQWYRERASDLFRQSLDRYWPFFEKYSLCKPKLQIQKMNKRWGSLSVNGRLTLNVDLIRAPRECIDYVVVHELAHLIYKKHGGEFYRFVDKIMPGWKIRKRRLEITLA